MSILKKAIAMLLLTGVFSAYAQSAAGYRISSVTYDIEGSTREFPLRNAVTIDKTTVFPSLQEFDSYIDNIRTRLSNERVFESSSVEAIHGEAAVDGIVPVSLTIHTVDTVNIIAFPYPKFDSNDGFIFKLKLKNYNFFGSMQLLDTSLDYAVDNDGDTSIEGGVSFTIPFMAYGYAFEWDFDAAYTYHVGEDPEFDLSTGLDFALPLSFADLHFGVVQSFAVNDRDDDDSIYEDRAYFTEKFYIELPITLYDTVSKFGKLVWTPYTSLKGNWDHNGIDEYDLKGPDFEIGHSLSFGRVDWVNNFRRGYSISVKNYYIYDFTHTDTPEIAVSATAQGFYSFYDRVGINSQLHGFYNFDDYISDDVADYLRGILDDRIDTDTAIFLNVDIPVRVLRVNFEEVTGISWTKYISFEMQFMPFFDMALTHDLENDTMYSFEDGWYAGGLEVLVFPMKMRSIYARASVGFDLTEVINQGSLSGNADRDGEAIREYSIGIGLYY